ncbi:hypothetical protein HYPSUDRAFT_35254 [Hypholoma sublateritium FD-334 SS-4]|uniref:Uncharacterized protein n=1 Tax=Hypholoma sublateritium (strain FD-334 SS-4) TaxID=945553 RepID=A0A0D2P8R8_HYPSF|nr:hypothetical protein HYPSUDRAFT_35254 [Hypholoma sublateritium FD-334 SS-4]
MKTTHPTTAEFSRFKSSVRESSKYLLKLGGKADDITPRQWRNLIEMVLLEEPSLSHYEDHWPIRQYTITYMRGMKEASRRHRYSQDLQCLSAAKKSATVLRKRNRRKTVPSVIDLEVIELTSREGTPSLEPRSPIWKTTDHTSCYSPTSESRRTQVVSQVGSSTSTFTGRPFQNQFQLLRNEGLRPHKSHLPSETVSIRTALCYLCGPPVEIDFFLNNRLAQLTDDPCTLKTLQSLGICFDQHLDFLVCLDEAIRSEFVDSIPLERMNALAKFKLLKSFKQLALNNVQAEGIPRSIVPPSIFCQEYAILLANSKKFRDWLQKAMTLENDDAIFQDLLNIMDTHSTRLFIIKFPVIDHLRATIRAIVDERPVYFRHYPGYWPIRLYLNHRQEMLGCTTPQYDSQREEEAFIDVFARTFLSILRAFN